MHLFAQAFDLVSLPFDLSVVFVELQIWGGRKDGKERGSTRAREREGKEKEGERDGGGERDAGRLSVETQQQPARCDTSTDTLTHPVRKTPRAHRLAHTSASHSCVEA